MLFAQRSTSGCARKLETSPSAELAVRAVNNVVAMLDRHFSLMPLVKQLFLSCSGSWGNAKAGAIPKITIIPKPRYIKAGVQSRVGAVPTPTPDENLEPTDRLRLRLRLRLWVP